MNEEKESERACKRKNIMIKSTDEPIEKGRDRQKERERKRESESESGPHRQIENKKSVVNRKRRTSE